MKKFIDVYYEGLLSGISDGKTISDIAKKHGVKYNQIVTQLRKGRRVEMEHTKSKDIAMRIALDHLMEDPDYYDKLATIEEGVYSTMEGWMLPNGKYIPNHSGEGHYGSLRRLTNEPKPSFEVVFKKGWQRIVSIGENLYANNSMVRPNARQISELKDLVIENNKNELLWDNDSEDRVIWRNE